jgi:hypothetical protein
LEQSSNESVEKQRYSSLSCLVDEQYALSRDLYALTESQRRLVQGMESRPAGIAKALEATELRIREVIDRLCELREEIRMAHRL